METGEGLSHWSKMVCSWRGMIRQPREKKAFRREWERETKRGAYREEEEEEEEEDICKLLGLYIYIYIYSSFIGNMKRVCKYYPRFRTF